MELLAVERFAWLTYYSGLHTRYGVALVRSDHQLSAHGLNPCYTFESFKPTSNAQSMNVTFSSCAFRIFDWERYDRNCLINWPSWRRKRLTALLCFQAKLASFASFMRWRTFCPQFVHRLALYRITPHLKTLRDSWELMSLVSGEKSVKCTR